MALAMASSMTAVAAGVSFVSSASAAGLAAGAGASAAAGFTAGEGLGEGFGLGEGVRWAKAPASGNIRTAADGWGQLPSQPQELFVARMRRYI